MTSSGEVYGFEGRAIGSHTMSLRAYILVLTAYIVGGLGLAASMATYTYDMDPSWWWFVGYLALAISGIVLSAKSPNWVVSSVGYLLVIVPTGAVTGPLVALFTMESVVQVLLVTTGATAVLGIAGTIYPKSVEHWGGFLLMGLVLILLAELSSALFVGLGLEPVTLGAIGYTAAALFCGFIFYEMHRAVRRDYTLDNAADAAVSLYLDVGKAFIRLFMRLLDVLAIWS